MPPSRRDVSINQPISTATNTKAINAPISGHHMRKTYRSRRACAPSPPPGRASRATRTCAPSPPPGQPGRTTPARRGAPPARWAAGMPTPPGAAAPGGTRTGAGWGAAARRGGPAGRSGTVGHRPPRRAGFVQRSSSRSSPAPLPDRSPYLKLPACLLKPTCGEGGIKTDVRERCNVHFRKTQGNQNCRKPRKLRALCARPMPGAANSAGFRVVESAAS